MSLLVNFSASVPVSKSMEAQLLLVVNIISLYILPVSVIYDLSPSSTSVLHHTLYFSYSFHSQILSMTFSPPFGHSSFKSTMMHPAHAILSSSMLTLLPPYLLLILAPSFLAPVSALHQSRCGSDCTTVLKNNKPVSLCKCMCVYQDANNRLILT